MNGYLVIFQHPDEREVDDRGERHQRRVFTEPVPDREAAIHLGWRQNARIAMDQTRPLYEFVSATPLGKDGLPARRGWRFSRR